MSRSSPPSAQGQSPDATQDRYAPDPYLSAASDPEEIFFQASAIRLTPSRGSPGHSAGPGSSPHEDARIDSTIQGYLNPRANDYTDPSNCTSPISDTSVFVEPKDIELGSGSTWQEEDLPSYRIGEANVLVDPAWGSSMAPNAFQWTSSDHNPNSNPSSAPVALEPHGNSSMQQSTSTSYQSGLGVLPNEELPTGLASNASRGRSPVFKITTFSRGDSPKERSMSPQRRLSSFTHLSANPSELEDEDDGDHHSVSSAPVKRSKDGGWIPNPSTHLAGIDPSSRGDELVSSPNDVYVQRERNEKNEDISHWSVSVSVANSDADGDSPSPPRPRPRHVSRRLRARSTGDHPLGQEDYFNIKSRTGDGSFPGPGVLVHESSEDLSEDQASIGTYSDEPSADVDEPGRYDRSTPEVYSSLSPTKAEESICLYPWHDPPRDPTPRSQAMQPDSSTDAMIAFNRRVRDLETASLAATIDNNSIINVTTSLSNFSFAEQPKKRHSLFKRQFLQASSKLKRQASDLSIGQSNSYPGLPQRDAEDSSVKPSYSPRNGFFRHSRSPSLSNALLSMTSQMAAVGGSQPVRAVSPAPSPNPERSSLNIQFKGRVRSRSEIPRPSNPGLINLMTTHGGPPVPSITSPRVSSDADQTPRSSPLGPETGGAEDENDVNTGNKKGVVMDFPAIQSLPVPTIEGFRSQIMQLNPRLEPALIHRLAHEQNRRYKILVGLQQKHSIATANHTCKSGNYCTVQGGQPTLLQDLKAPTDPEAGQIQFQVTNFSYGHEEQYAAGEGTGAAPQFPPGVPPPPVSRLPARFECPICFEVKTFQKPSDWSKHVQEDVQPFTCTFPDCTEPKSFKRKADWVRHENEKHRHLEWWTCAFPECNHKCYRKDNFVQHLVREHKMPEPKIKKTGKASSTVEPEAVPNSRREQELERLWQMVEDCQHDTTQAPQEEPCRFCGNVCNEWRKLSVHLGKHLEQLALPVLRLAKPSSAATHLANPSQVEPTRGSSATYPFVAPYHHGHEVPETASTHLQPQYAIRNTSTPANPAFSINNGPLTDYSTISGGELSQEPESITDSLTPDQFPAYTHSTGQFGQTTLHPAQAQAYPLHQNSVTYPPPYNAVPRSRSSEADPMLQNSYPLTQFLPHPSLYPVDGNYPAYQQPMESNIPYTSATYSSGCPSRM
ncbi:Zinc finger C2H2 [Penicillium cf. griseofulvum]|uniref:Zinc finger C2H2 n=1 Tax=Penicillium cf. griseofulvum TaxID=2972120 RepID=A0A9W9JTJ4_9EURO|nr:Zinc finger C2H2 [Penicillium cf. griseofulvum]KAJ5424350.1 Zinc finger C2H2 [Penicillium cf. griseofulvum]